MWVQTVASRSLRPWAHTASPGGALSTMEGPESAGPRDSSSSPKASQAASRLTARRCNGSNHPAPLQSSVIRTLARSAASALMRTEYACVSGSRSSFEFR